MLAVSYDHEPGLYGNLLSQNRNGVTSYYHYDGRGDTVALTDDSGNVTDAKECDAWGNVIASTASTVTPYQFKGRSNVSGIDGGFVAVADSIYAPVLGRWTSSVSSNAIRPLVNTYRSDIFSGNETESKCYRILMATMAGWKSLGNNCAFDLMKASFSGSTAACPDSCVSTIRNRGFDYITFCAERSFAVIGECGKEKNFRFHSSGSHKELNPGIPKLNSPLSDMFYAFGKFEWNADGYCSWNCEPNNMKDNELGLQCCPCAGTCGFDVVIKDTYDFDPPPQTPPTVLNPLYCAEPLSALGRLSKMQVRCPVGLNNQQKIKGHTCWTCSPLWSDDPRPNPSNPPRHRPYDPTAGDGWCPGTGTDPDGNVIFRNTKKAFSF